MMPSTETLGHHTVLAAVLVTARAIVADPARWCHYHHAKDANGHTCEGRSGPRRRLGRRRRLSIARPPDAGAAARQLPRRPAAPQGRVRHRRAQVDRHTLAPQHRGRARHDRGVFRRSARHPAQAARSRPAPRPRRGPHPDRPARALGAGRHRPRPGAGRAPRHLRRRLPLLRRRRARPCQPRADRAAPGRQAHRAPLRPGRAPARLRRLRAG